MKLNMVLFVCLFYFNLGQESYGFLRGDLSLISLAMALFSHCFILVFRKENKTSGLC